MKVSRINLVHLKTKQTKIYLPKLTLQYTNNCLVIVLCLEITIFENRKLQKLEVLLSDVVRNPHHRLDAPKVFLTSLDPARLSPKLVLNQKAESKESGLCVTFKTSTSDASKLVYREESVVASGSQGNLVRASNLLLSNVGLFCIQCFLIQNLFWPMVGSRC